MSFRAGIASTKITPTESMWMAGFAARREPSAGVETNLYAKALAIEDAAGNRIVIVTADLIAVSREIADYVCAQLKQKANLNREQILLTTSHTHCGPEVRPSKVPFFRIPEEFAKKIPGYVAKLQDQVVAICLEALGSMEEVTLTAHETSANFAGNRRGHEAWFDHSVPVLVVRRAAGHGSRTAGELKAIVFGYACHNTTLRADFIRFCGDYAGYAQIKLQKTFPTAQAMFIAGAGADQNSDPQGTVEITQQHGHSLAQAVTDAIKSPNAKEISGTIKAAFENVPLEYLPFPTREKLQEDLKSQDQPVATKAKFLLEQLDAGKQFEKTYPCPLHAIRFGDQLTMIAIGGEPVIDFAIAFKKKFNVPVLWVAGYANDMFGYVPTVRVQREGGYEGGRAMLWAALPTAFTETVEQSVIDAADRLMKQVNV